jgi:hypothetical protein
LLITNSNVCHFTFQDHQITSLNKDRNLVYSFDSQISTDEWCKVDAAKSSKFEEQGNVSPFLTPQYIKENFMDIKYAEGNYENVNSWQLIYVARRKLIGNVCNVFHGRIYFDAKRMQLMLVLVSDKSFRKLTHFNEDLQFKLLKAGGAIDSAFTFAEKVRVLISEFKCKPQLFIAGESLAGCLAQIIAFAVKFCYIDEFGKVWFSNEQGLRSNPRTLVFNSPSAQQIISRFTNNDSGEVYAQLDINKFNLSNRAASEGGNNLLNEPDDDVETAGASGMQLKPNNSQRSISKSCLLPEELEALQVLPLYALVNKDLKIEIPDFTIEENSITLYNDASPEEFIPKVRALVENNRADFQIASILVQQKFNNMILSKRRILVDQFENNDFKLSEEVLSMVNGWCSGSKICGLVKDVDKVLFAQLLQNTIPNLFYLAASDFVQLNIQDSLFNGVLVLIDDICQHSSKQLQTNIDQIPQTKAKIIYLVAREADGSDYCQAAPQLKHLNQESQDTLRKTKLQFMGNEMEAEKLFGELIGDHTISEILSFKRINETDARDEKDFYFDQGICSDDKENGFNGSVEEFTKKYQPQDCVLMNGAPGMGKSVAMRRIMVALQKKLPHYCIPLCNLSTISAFVGNISTLDDICKIAAKIVLQERSASPVVSTNMLETIILRKLKAKEAIFLIDDLDQVEPLQKEQVKRFVQTLSNSKFGVLVAARSKSILGSNFFASDRSFSLKPVQQNDRHDFVAKYIECFVESFNKEMISAKFTEEFAEELWGVPLHLMLVAESLKVETHSYFRPFKMLIAGATSVVLRNVEETKYSGLSRSLLKNVYRLAACAIFNNGKYTDIKFSNNDASVLYLKNFPLLSLNTILKSVSFTDSSITEYLVAEALVRAFQQDPDVDIQDYCNERLVKVFTTKEFGNVRSRMDIILQRAEGKIFRNLNGDLADIKGILLALIKDGKLELYKLLEACHTKIDYKRPWDVKCSRVKESPLYVALEHANDEFVQHLVQKGAKLDTIPKEKLYTLHWAVKFPTLNSEVKNCFKKLEKKLTARYQNKTPLDYAEASGNAEMVEFMIKKGAVVNSKSSTDGNWT